MKILSGASGDMALHPCEVLSDSFLRGLIGDTTELSGAASISSASFRPLNREAYATCSNRSSPSKVDV